MASHIAKPYSQFRNGGIPSISPTFLWFLFALLCVAPFNAQALEKYGRPLPSMKQAGEDSLNAESPLLSGYFLTSVFPYNPSYFARPDNSGLVGMRHMLHLETDLYKQYLTF